MREETLQVQSRRGDTPDVLIVELSGPLLCQNLFDFQQTTRSSGARVLIINMTNVPYVDSAGVGALVGAYVSYQKEGHRLALVGVNDRVTSLFNMTQVERFFTTFSTVEEAQGAFIRQSAHSAAG